MFVIVSLVHQERSRPKRNGFRRSIVVNAGHGSYSSKPIPLVSGVDTHDRSWRFVSKDFTSLDQRVDHAQLLKRLGCRCILGAAVIVGGVLSRGRLGARRLRIAILGRGGHLLGDLALLDWRHSCVVGERRKVVLVEKSTPTSK